MNWLVTNHAGSPSDTSTKRGRKRNLRRESFVTILKGDRRLTAAKAGLDRSIFHFGTNLVADRAFIGRTAGDMPSRVGCRAEKTVLATRQ